MLTSLQISALIVSNTFTSIPDIVRTWPIIGAFSFLCHQKWNSAAKIHRIPTTTPILMLSGRCDEVVPAKLMDKLWALAEKRGEKQKSRWWHRKKSETITAAPAPINDVFRAFEAGNHCKPQSSLGYDLFSCFVGGTVDLPPYWEAVGDFIWGSVKTHSLRIDTTIVPSNPRAKVDIRWRYIDRELVVETAELT